MLNKNSCCVVFCACDYFHTAQGFCRSFWSIKVRKREPPSTRSKKLGTNWERDTPSHPPLTMRLIGVWTIISFLPSLATYIGQVINKWNPEPNWKSAWNEETRVSIDWTESPNNTTLITVTPRIHATSGKPMPKWSKQSMDCWASTRWPKRREKHHASTGNFQVGPNTH